MIYGYNTISRIWQNKPTLLQIKNTLRMSTESGDSLSQSHKVNKLERRFLVWTGKYKSVEEVPNFVGQHVMERARNLMRIKIANYMMAATVAGCILMIYLGKQDAKRGESVSKMNLEWHKKYNEAEAEKKSN